MRRYTASRLDTATRIFQLDQIKPGRISCKIRHALNGIDPRFVWLLDRDARQAGGDMGPHVGDARAIDRR